MTDVTLWAPVCIAQCRTYALWRMDDGFSFPAGKTATADRVSDSFMRATDASSGKHAGDYQFQHSARFLFRPVRPGIVSGNSNPDGRSGIFSSGKRSGRGPW